MATDNDTDLMAALFVSREGELGCFPQHKDERFFFGEDGSIWDRVVIPYVVPEHIATGILRLLRGRDEAKRVAQEWINAYPFDRLAMLESELDQAQEAAETYWEAWQDACVWWKEKVAQLQAQRDEALSQLAERDQMNEIEFYDRMETDR